MSPSLRSRGSDVPGLLSLASVMSLPIGPRFDADGIDGFHVDLRIKAQGEPVWPPHDHEPLEERLWIAEVQHGIGAYERFLAGDGDAWLQVALDAGDDLLEHQGEDGAWRHRYDYPHTFVLRAGWPSGITQGEAASLLVRLHKQTGDERYAEGARRALAPLRVPGPEGGCLAMLGGRPFPEEYPTSPPSYVLNGSLFAVWGLRDVAVGLGDPDAVTAWADAVTMLKENLHRWDTGYWSRYDLHPHPLPNVASSFYHDLHIAQLRATALLAKEPAFDAVADRWAGYATRRGCQARAFAAKAAFRVAVPRSRKLAQRLPWARDVRAAARA
jgi:hypothetical protein